MMCSRMSAGETGRFDAGVGWVWVVVSVNVGRSLFNRACLYFGRRDLSRNFSHGVEAGGLGFPRLNGSGGRKARIWRPQRRGCRPPSA
jgi:hypothetical protein